MSFWSGKNILVTGATGLVGSWLVRELLAQEANVSCLVWDADPTSDLISSKLIDRYILMRYITLNPSSQGSQVVRR